MNQNHSVLEEIPQPCVRTARFFDDEMDGFDHTTRGGTLFHRFRVANARNY